MSKVSQYFILKQQWLFYRSNILIPMFVCNNKPKINSFDLRNYFGHLFKKKINDINLGTLVAALNPTITGWKYGRYYYLKYFCWLVFNQTLYIHYKLQLFTYTHYKWRYQVLMRSPQSNLDKSNPPSSPISLIFFSQINRIAAKHWLEPTIHRRSEYSKRSNLNAYF